MLIKVVNDRLTRISTMFSELGLDRVKVFEDFDPQLRAAKLISYRCSSLTPYILFTNALVTYQLSMDGETYWMKFAELVSDLCPSSYDDVLEVVIKALKKLHKFAVNEKEKRLNKLRLCMDIYDLISGGDFNLIRSRVSKCLGAGINDKTIVFSIKMIYYGVKSLGRDILLPFDIPIPIDRRVVKISYTSGLIDIEGLSHYTSDKYVPYDKVIRSKQSLNILRDAWSKVSLESSIPPLHLDTVLWLIGKYCSSESKTQAFNSLIHDLGEEILERVGVKYVKMLIYELLYRLPQ